ncbi:MAG: ion transporter [Gammaproteobacteria bacterium]|nr:ion transporter [Gammaproteobacteria bacterium]MDE0440986.1 ion transporter [Gammaproteobacteria bacterium]
MPGRPPGVLQIQRRLDLAAAPLIVLSAGSVAVGGDLAGSNAAWLDRIETALSVLFTGEYCYRLYLGRRRYAFSFFGVVDLLAGVPGLIILAGGQELLALRVLRLFRLLALLKLGRYGRAAARLGAALRSVREEFALLGATAGTVLCLAAVGIRHFEQDVQPEYFATFGDCLWWAVVSLTTVGYGDVYPVTTGGKAFASVILLLSLGIVAAPAGLIAAALSAQRESARGGSGANPERVADA